MARRASNVAVAAQDLVEDERLAKIDERRILDGHRPDWDRTRARQGFPQLAVEWRGQRLRRREPVAAGDEPEQAEADGTDGACHQRLLAHLRGSEIEIWCVVVLTSCRLMGPLGATRILPPARARSRPAAKKPEGDVATPGRPVPFATRPR